MLLPKFNNLYGRIFAIFWLTMLLVLIAVLTLPHLDPRQSRDMSSESLARMHNHRQALEQRFAEQEDLTQVITTLEANNRHHSRVRLFVSDQEGNILNLQRHENFQLKALKNFTTGIESVEKPQQRLYGRYMIAGPVPIRLAQQDLLLYIGMRWDQPPPFLLRLFDKPLHLLLAVMLVSTPLLLWLAWALSKPAQRLALAAQRVARGEFVVEPNLEKGPIEFRQAGRSFNQMVQALNQIISGQQRLLSDISHELRSPLTRLRMANALATRKQGQSQELERIDTEAQRLERMINELLELSRMQTNSHLSHEAQPISSLWEALLDDAQFEAEQNQKTLQLEPIPEQVISGNPQLLMSALENIIRNAIHYADQRIEVRFHLSKQQITVTVEDDGPGVEQHELADIFRPFYRVSTARERDSGGSGLGLAITESAIRQHNGQINASRSQLGGLKVQFTLPTLG